ncbi:MAG: hypothetical protein COY66_03550 [Candidatus Kerfeldbacteria bacterium CG_4_10_14_0_8_um_filter_42_10]|uniref:Glycerophosphoryl diester phosphodiesterase membrane domain-containing protein n=1 Tax=Candidatus Kerfeldbacteria bacterium CG_4_10_14_0_8_um_filter_42_10 TaxID=2014248 RepID=A0A2M7RIP8_9BACT|nr:MAG: hypothetical protein COY66_03550 [Candidatus Kerfeldbacteria bacterium CG_4_10_14_0_8_um_filter_42_10]
MIFLYRDILKEAWWITWRNRFLWFFGLFAALLGNGGEYEIIFRNVDTVSNQRTIIYNLQNMSKTGHLQTTWDNIVSYFSAYTLNSVALLLVALVIFVFIVWLVIISQGGLIDSSLKLQSKQNATLESGFVAGRKHFMPLFLLNLLWRVVVYGLLFIVGIPLIFLLLNEGNDFWFTITSFVILVPIAVIISFIIKYSSAFVIYKKEKIGPALKDGWKLFTKNWLISIEMAFVILLINLLFGLALIIGIGLLSIPFVFLLIILKIVGALAAFNVIFYIAVIALFILIFIMGAFISAFQWVAWVGLFKRLVEGKGASKILRMFGKIPNYVGKQ